MPNIVYVLADLFTSNGQGGQIQLREGEPWAVDDPLVKSRPELFTDSPRLRRTVEAPVIETTTAAPGERRGFLHGR